MGFSKIPFRLVPLGSAKKNDYTETISSSTPSVFMCGRFALTASEQALYEQFHLTTRPTWASRYNIAPSQEVLVVRSTPAGLTAQTMRWGLVPRITAHASRPMVHINARAETVAVKPSFKEAVRTRRGLILMSGFFEWQERQPFYIQAHDAPLLAVAALWEDGVEAPGPPHPTCCLLTTTAHAALHAIHPRMPAVLTAEESAVWLNPEETRPTHLLPLLHPDTTHHWVYAPVNPKVNSWRWDVPEALLPYPT